MLLQHEKFVTNGKMYFSSWLKRNNNFLNVVTILWKSPLWYVIPYCHLSDPLPLPVKYVFLLKNYVLKILGFLSMHQYAFTTFPYQECLVIPYMVLFNIKIIADYWVLTCWLLANIEERLHVLNIKALRYKLFLLRPYRNDYGN